jgi:hypothetical protein
MAILCFLVSSRGECQEQSRIFVTIEEPKVQSRLKEWITMKDGNAQGREIGATRAPCVGWETDAGTAFDCRASGFKHNLMLCVTLHRFSSLCFSERRSEARDPRIETLVSTGFRAQILRHYHVHACHGQSSRLYPIGLDVSEAFQVPRFQCPRSFGGSELCLSQGRFRDF